MTTLIFGAAFFVGLHLLVSGTRFRDEVTARTGEQAYLGLFSLASLAGLIWVCVGYAKAPSIELWAYVPGVRTFTAAFAMPAAFVLAVVGLTTPSPTAVGAEKLLKSADPATGILRITRHPFLWGAGIWAAAHLVANGDVASLIFFGSFLVLTATGTRSIDAKRERKHGEDWRRFAEVTSNVPFAAILSGRNRLVLRELATWRLGAAAAAYALVYYYHDSLF